MIIGIFSDAHSNEIGFYKCLEYLKKYVDKIYYLGDTVGYFPLSNKILDTLRANDVTCLKGNHDAMLLGEIKYEDSREQIYQIAASRALVNHENYIFLQGLKSQIEIEIDGQQILFVHGSPFNSLEEYVYEDSDITSFEDLNYNAIFMGHTHRAYVKNIGAKNYVNVGSCGLPRDIGNRITAVTYNTMDNRVILHEIEMDVEEVLMKYGEFIDDAVKNVLKRNNKIFNNE